MGLNPLNLIRVMPAKEREFVDWPSHPSSSSAPALPASPVRSNSPSAASASRWSSAAARWARAAARGWPAACWRRGASAPPPNPRSPTGARRRSTGGPSAFPRRCARAAWWSRSRATCPISRASPRAPSASTGWMPIASPRSSPILAAASGARCSSPTRPISIRGARSLRWPGACRTAASPIRFGVELAPQDARADIVVDCRGLAARDALPDLRGVRGEMVVVRSPDVSLQRPVRMLHPRIPLYIVPRGNGLFMIGATMIESERRGPVSVRSAVELLNAAYALHPAFGEAEIVELGADLRPAFPDNLPRRPAERPRAARQRPVPSRLPAGAGARAARRRRRPSMLQPETNHADLPQRRRA